MFRRSLGMACAVIVLAACGGGKSGGVTTVVDPKEAVRAQARFTVENYVQSIGAQMPDVTSKVDVADIVSCVQDRVNQLIDSAVIAPGQPEAQFASTLLNQVQGSLYGMVGMCAQLSG